MTAPLVLYGHFFTGCIYESAHALQSLHSTKAAAYRAMRRAHLAAYNVEREGWLKFGRRFGGRRGMRYCEFFSRRVWPVILQD